MWIVLNDAFVSAVESNEQGKLLVRARIEGDLQNLFGEDIKVITNDDTDYRFRVVVTKEQFAEVISKRVLNIDYRNFKNSVKDKTRASYYSDIWSVMNGWQEKLYGGLGRMWNSYFKEKYGVSYSSVSGTGNVPWTTEDESYLISRVKANDTIEQIYKFFGGDYSILRLKSKMLELDLV